MRLFAYMFPNMLLYTIPMASMMGIIIGFSRLSNDYEILAIKASGISIYQILPPVATIATVIALLTGFISIQLIPASEVSLKKLTHILLKEQAEKGIREYQFTEALGNLVVHIGEINPDSGEWKNVWVSDVRDKNSPTITMASSGRIINDHENMELTILLENGSLHKPDDKDAHIVNFEQYKIFIPITGPGKNFYSRHRNSLTMQELLTTADELGPDTDRGRIMIVEYHERLVLPVGCLILTLLGLPLGLQAGPGKKMLGIPLGLASFILYYVFFTFGKMIAREGLFNISTTMWLPNGFFFLLTIYAIYRTTHEKMLLPESLNRFLIKAITITTRFFVSVVNRIIAKRT